MKRITLGLTFSVLSLTTAAFAGGPDHMAMPSQDTASTSGHFFIGAEGGMGMLDAKQTSNTNTQFQVGSNSFLGGLLLGYDKVFNNGLYAGIVGNALYNSLNSGFSTTGAQTLKNTFQGGAAIRLGKKMGNATPYILGGVEAGSWKYTALSTSKTSTLVGPQVGAGVLFNLCSHWNAGLEYAYTWFGNMTTTTAATTNKIKVNQNQMLASVSYQF